jgi:hypothetical protein
LARRFARHLHDEGNVGIRKHVTGRIDRSAERRIFEPPPKPSSQLKPVEPQRRLRERLEKPLALRCVEPRPAFHHSLNQINAPHLVNLKRNSAKENRKSKIPNTLEACGHAVPAFFFEPQRTQKSDDGGGRPVFEVRRNVDRVVLDEVRTEIANVCQQMADKYGEPPPSEQG